MKRHPIRRILSLLLSPVFFGSFSGPGDTVGDILPQMRDHAEVSVQRLRERRHTVIQQLEILQFRSSEIQNLYGVRPRRTAA